MARTTSRSIGHEIVAQLMHAIKILRGELRPGARGLPALCGLTARAFRDPQENVLQNALKILAGSRRLYVLDGVIHLEVSHGNKKSLTPLYQDQAGQVAALLSNVFVVNNGEKEIPLPVWFVRMLLASEVIHQGLPCIQGYFNRPVFTLTFQLCGPGWHAASGILVHGSPVEPYLEEPQLEAANPVDRLPPHLRHVLRGFCFKSPADVANTVGMMLTGVLCNHFVESQKALCLVDGNQPGLGKTLLVQLIAVILDGDSSNIITFTSNEDELGKHICATLRNPRRQSLLLIDNAKTGRGSVLSSPFLEANSTASRLSLRILGLSTNFELPNHLLWFLTMNNTRASQDLLSRSCVIQLAFEQRPDQRLFELPDPIAYARKNRLAILGELVGMVIRWHEKGRTPGAQYHRQHAWASIIGGILTVAGFPEFLGNTDQAAASFSSDLQLLGELASRVVERSLQTSQPTSQLVATPPVPPAAWIDQCHVIGLFGDQFNRSDIQKSKPIRVGQFLSPLVNRAVPIDVLGVSGVATLRSNGNNKKKQYHFELAWDPLTPSAAEATEIEMDTASVPSEHQAVSCHIPEEAPELFTPPVSPAAHGKQGSM